MTDDPPGDPPIPVDMAADGALYYRALPHGLYITVWPMGWGQGYLCVGDGWVHDSTYAYYPMDKAVEAARLWSGEGDPIDGWHRHMQSGRRRENGDPNKETIRW